MQGHIPRLEVGFTQVYKCMHMERERERKRVRVSLCLGMGFEVRFTSQSQFICWDFLVYDSIYNLPIRLHEEESFIYNTTDAAKPEYLHFILIVLLQRMCRWYKSGQSIAQHDE